MIAETGEGIPKDITQEEFKAFREYINQHSGIFLEDQKMDSLRVSLITRATRKGASSLFEYLEMLQSSEDEFNELMNLITINETSFFRFPQQFEALRVSVIPEIISSKGVSDRRFRVWSAGCSTGEEPYTLAMTLLDSGLVAMGFTPEVMGTDVSTNALLKAKRGVYPAKSISNLSPSVVSRYFEPTPHGSRVVEQARNIVTFQYHNLIKEPYPLALMGNWDVIFCRNVTIYFKLESTRRVVQNLYDSLNPGGYLFVGHSETLAAISDRFEPVEVGGVFLYRKSLGRKYRLSEKMSERSPARRPAGLSAAAAGDDTRRRRVFSDASKRRTDEVSADASHEVGELLALAESAAAAGEHASAAAYAGKVLELDSKNVRALLLLANAHADEGDLDSAYNECRKVLAIDPLFAAARYVLGMIYLRRDEKMLALSEFRRTIYVDPGFALAHLNLGNLYRSMGAVQDACKEYEMALRTIYENPEGDWTKFMGGFKPDLLAKTIERSLVECRKGALDV